MLNTKPKLNIVFAGTPSFAAEILTYLIEQINIEPNKYNISAVYTQPDRPAGRGRINTPSEVKQSILNHTNPVIPIEQPLNFSKLTTIEHLAKYKPDLIIVVAYGLILPKAVLKIPKYGCINIHTSLLPRWRGAAPIQRAILAGDTQTGVSIQQMDAGLDTGPILATTICDITSTDTTITLTKKLLELAKPLLINLIDNISTGSQLPATIQDNNLANYAHKLNKSEANINWSIPAIDIDRQIRSFNPWPIAETHTSNIPFKILEAKVIIKPNTDDAPSPIPGTIVSNKILTKKTIVIQTGENQLEIIKLQFSGGKIITSIDALNGKYKTLLTTGNILT